MNTVMDDNKVSLYYTHVHTYASCSVRVRYPITLHTYILIVYSYTVLYIYSCNTPLFAYIHDIIQ